MPPMKCAPPLVLEPRASPIGRLLVVVGSAATAVLIAWLPLDFAFRIAALLVVVQAAIDGIRRCAGRGLPVSLVVGVDRRIAVRHRDGNLAEGLILDATYVGARLATIVWRPDGDRSGRRFLHPARTIVVLPDTLPADDFRRLRVVLRYGRVASPERGTRGAVAG
jgi:hypothetical protein